LTAKPVLAHNIAEFDGQFAPARIGSIESSDGGPPARPHYPVRNRRAPRATRPITVAHGGGMRYIAPDPQSIRQCEILRAEYEQLTTGVVARIQTLSSEIN
jgi:hypothetical protein